HYPNGVRMLDFNPRGTSCCVGAAEASTGSGTGTTSLATPQKSVSGTSALYLIGGPSAFPTTVGAWNHQPNCFSASGCHVLLMDGSVRGVTPDQKTDFNNCSDPNINAPPGAGW